MHRTRNSGKAWLNSPNRPSRKGALKPPRAFTFQHFVDSLLDRLQWLGNKVDEVDSPSQNPVDPSLPNPPVQTPSLHEGSDIFIPQIGFTVAQAFPDLKQMREDFGAMLPSDITYSTVVTGNPALDAEAMAFRASYDEGYCGHFSLPSVLGPAVNFDKVLATSDPFSFIKKHLTFQPQAGLSTMAEGELIIFGPGLNTFHDRQGDQKTAPSRLQHYSDILGCPLAQLHVGTDKDQGDVQVQLTPAVQAAFSLHGHHMHQMGLYPIHSDSSSVTFHSGQRDKLEAGLAVVGFSRPVWQTNIIRLLEANEKARRALVIMPYSRTTVEITTALKKYIAQFQARGKGSKADAEALLLQTLTVVTLGNNARQYVYPDGPAYVHVGGWSVDQEGPPPRPGSQPKRGTDVAIFWEGVNAGTPEAAGRDAVFVHSDWLWSTSEAHNFASSGAASLRLVLAKNGVKGFRELYERLRKGEELKKPSFEEVRAAVALVDGKNYMWNKGPAPWAGVGELPSKQKASLLVGKWF